METLTDRQVEILRAAIDRIIPGDDEQSGGVAAGVDAFILRNLSLDGFFPSKREIYRAGLNEIDGLARQMYSASFAELPEGAQDAVLIKLDTSNPGFFHLLVEQAQEGFYTSPAAYEMIGWEVSG